MELIYNSVINSFEKVNELIDVLNHHKLEWKSELNVKLLNECMSLAEKLFINLNLSQKLSKEAKHDLNARHNNEIAKLKDALSKDKNSSTIKLSEFGKKK
jgi:hypothetical protein